MLAKVESISAIVANCDSIAGTSPERSSSSSAEAGSMSCSVSSSFTWVSNQSSPLVMASDRPAAQAPSPGGTKPLDTSSVSSPCRSSTASLMSLVASSGTKPDEMMSALTCSCVGSSPFRSVEAVRSSSVSILNWSLTAGTMPVSSTESPALARAASAGLMSSLSTCVSTCSSNHFTDWVSVSARPAAHAPSPGATKPWLCMRTSRPWRSLTASRMSLSACVGARSEMRSDTVSGLT
mmetsp:Transcript_5308/g.17114  ORF Transcript_5308/g.17114 Transcript_5308/m.17114 type:complete len:237 (-) Transcript_5308:284-994(-)